MTNDINDTKNTNEKNKSSKSNEQIAVQVSFVGILFNIILTAFKLSAGIIAGSMAMVSDAVHSMSDILGGAIVLVGIKLSNKKSDKEHPYGHERFECVVAIILAAILAATGFVIGYGGAKNIFSGDYQSLAIPGLLALIAAVVSIAVKEGLFWYTKIFAKKINSTALMAGAWHHRSDALSSVGSFVGILGARLGFPILDSAACIIICVFIVKAAYNIFMDAIGKMTDRTASDETIEEIREAIQNQGDFKIDQLKTRLFGDKIYVDIEISADGNLSLNQTHDIAENIHDAVEKVNPRVKHCMVHVNPQEH
ncbi:MAG: cation diffusion facilitator family transporter [Oscillospiraceae bacterium]|nr:cation diffusion facilitator family transporter [Oscillospiraceae bacterium]